MDNTPSSLSPALQREVVSVISAPNVFGFEALRRSRDVDAVHVGKLLHGVLDCLGDTVEVAYIRLGVARNVRPVRDVKRRWRVIVDLLHHEVLRSTSTHRHV